MSRIRVRSASAGGLKREGARLRLVLAILAGDKPDGCMGVRGSCTALLLPNPSLAVGDGTEA
ncbi:hypothetical protein D3C78_1750910 [compost metagenome]